MDSHALSKSFRFQKDGQAWKLWGDQLYTCQVVTSALVPVLVGILSTFDDKTTFAVLQITAIVFSIVGTICKGALMCDPDLDPDPNPNTFHLCMSSDGDPYPARQPSRTSTTSASEAKSGSNFPRT